MPDNVRVQLEKEAIEAYKEEFKDLGVTFQALDTKAQGAVAIAGIFVGGLFAFLNSSAFQRTPTSTVLLTLTLISLIASVACSVFVLRIRETMGPPTGEHTDNMVADLLLWDDGEIDSSLPMFFGDKARAWALSAHGLRGDVESKADLLWYSQVALLSGVIFVAILALVVLHSKEIG